MRRPHLEGLPPPVPPPGYRLRTYQPGDEAHWAAIMNSEGGIGRDWTPDKVRQRLTACEQFEPGCLFFATCDAEGGQPVASATAWRRPPVNRRTGYLHMVCALPEHRGYGLGRLVNLAVLHYFRAHSFADVILQTDDWRLAAMRGYLALGFVPEYVDDPASDHRARWSVIFARLLGAPTPA